MNYTGPKVRIARRLGIAFTPKAARIMEKKPHPPGQHGKDGKPYKKVSEYGRQLLEKQRLRAQYNIHECQMENYVERAVKRQGVSGDTLLQILETRLDAFVLRAGLATTIYAARQFVSHGHLLVDGQRVDLPAYELKIGQMVAVKPVSRPLPGFQMAVANANPPSYITLNKADVAAQLLRLPARIDIPVICDVQLVIEYYSR